MTNQSSQSPKRVIWKQPYAAESEHDYVVNYSYFDDEEESELTPDVPPRGRSTTSRSRSPPPRRNRSSSPTRRVRITTPYESFNHPQSPQQHQHDVVGFSVRQQMEQRQLSNLVWIIALAGLISISFVVGSIMQNYGLVIGILIFGVWSTYVRNQFLTLQQTTESRIDQIESKLNEIKLLLLQQQSPSSTLPLQQKDTNQEQQNPQRSETEVRTPPPPPKSILTNLHDGTNNLLITMLRGQQQKEQEDSSKTTAINKKNASTDPSMMFGGYQLSDIESVSIQQQPAPASKSDNNTTKSSKKKKKKKLLQQ